MPASSTSDLVQKLALAAKNGGGRALLIGGCVRDPFFGAEPKDFDMELFGIPEGKVVDLLNSVAANVIRVGRSFPVWKAWNGDVGAADAIDIALPRREVKTGSLHTDFAVKLDPRMSLAEAALRRDFTINAIALDPLTGEHIDPHGGIKDIKAGVLRHISEHFQEDPLRVLRGMQFAGRFNLIADPETVSFCQKLSADGLSSERLMEEWKKLILRGTVPSKGLQFLRATGWAKRFFPELAALKGISQEPEWHPEGDALTHTEHCLDAFAKRRTGNDAKDLRVGLAVVAHDFGKVTHTKFFEGRWRSHGHEAAGEAPAEAFLRRMTDQTDLIKGVKALVGSHMVPHDLYKHVERSKLDSAADSAIRRLSMRLAGEHTSIDELALVCECDHAGRPPLPERSPAVEWLRERAKVVQVLHERPKPLLLGRDLIAMGQTPGVGFKAVLEDAFNRQLSGEITTREEAIAVALNAIPEAHLNDGTDVVTVYRARELPREKSGLPSWTEGDPTIENARGASGRWFGDSLEEATWYLENENLGGEIVSLRLPAALAERYRVSNIPLKEGGKEAADNPAAYSRRPEHEFFLPVALASLVRPVLPDLLQGNGDPLSARRPPLPTPGGMVVSGPER